MLKAMRLCQVRYMGCASVPLLLAHRAGIANAARVHEAVVCLHCWRFSQTTMTSKKNISWEAITDLGELIA